MPITHSLEIVYALFEFKAENEDEISFRVGEPIIVHEKDELYGDGWWQGENIRGQIGLFPANYVEQSSMKQSSVTAKPAGLLAPPPTSQNQHEGLPSLVSPTLPTVVPPVPPAESPAPPPAATQLAIPPAEEEENRVSILDLSNCSPLLPNNNIQDASEGLATTNTITSPSSILTTTTTTTTTKTYSASTSSSSSSSSERSSSPVEVRKDDQHQEGPDVSASSIPPPPFPPDPPLPPFTSNEPTTVTHYEEEEAEVDIPSFETIEINDWDVQQVCQWLISCNLESVVENFTRHEITGDILMELDMASLKELDINAFGKRYNVMQAIKTLKDKLNQQKLLQQKQETLQNMQKSFSAGAAYPAEEQASRPVSSYIQRDPAPVTIRQILPDKRSAHETSSSLFEVKPFMPTEEEYIPVAPVNTLPRAMNVVYPARISTPSGPPPPPPPTAPPSTSSGVQERATLPALPARRKTSVLSRLFEPKQQEPNTFINSRYMIRASKDTENSKRKQMIVNPEHQGWMKTPGSSVFSWKKRWFVLKETTLYYGKSPETGSVKLLCNLSGFKLVSDPDTHPGSFSFRVIRQDKAFSLKPEEYCFSCDHYEDARFWIKAMMKATIERNLNDPVLCSSNISTVSLSMARTLQPRPPSRVFRPRGDTHPPPQSGLRRQISLPTHHHLNRMSSTAAPIKEEEREEMKNQQPMTLKSRLSRSLEEGDRSKGSITTSRRALSPTAQPIKEETPEDVFLKSRYTMNNRSGSTIADDKFTRRQYLDWMNYYLIRLNLQVEDLSRDLKSGVALLRFVEVLTYGERGSSRWQTLRHHESGDPHHDVFLAFKLMEESGVDTEALDWEAVVEGQEDAILRTLCAIRYAFPKSVPESLKRSSMNHMF